MLIPTNERMLKNSILLKEHPGHFSSVTSLNYYTYIIISHLFPNTVSAQFLYISKCNIINISTQFAGLVDYITIIFLSADSLILNPDYNFFYKFRLG